VTDVLITQVEKIYLMKMKDVVNYREYDFPTNLVREIYGISS
jgi:hypothetical protein